LLLAFALPLIADEEQRDNPIIFAHLDWEPYIYQDANGNSVGLFMDLMEEVFEKGLNIRVEAHLRPWKRAQIEVQEGGADAMITVATPTRLDYSVRSDSPIFPLYMTLFTYSGHKQLEAIKAIKSVEDIKRLNLTAVSNIGNGWHEENIQKKGVSTVLVQTDESVVKVLARKRVDIFIDVAEGMNVVTKKMGLEREVLQTEVKFGPTDFHFLMSKKSKHRHLMPQINALVEKLWVDGSIARIVAKYSTP